MPLIDPIKGDATARAAWSMGYFGRTLYFNGPGAPKARKAFLRDEREVADPGAIQAMLEGGDDPIGALLDRTVRVCYAKLGTRAQAMKRERWERAEPTLNARCRLALALIPPAAAAATISRLLGHGLADRGVRLSRIHPALDDKRRIGTPDLLLSGPRSTVLIEMKVRGLPTRHMYDLKQMVQYLNLAIDDRRESGRIDSVHVLLRPARGGAICHRRKAWFPDSVDGQRIHFDSRSVRRLAKAASWGSRLDAQLALRSLSHIPVFERTYAQLFSAVPVSAWSGSLGSIAQTQLQLVVDNAEPVTRP